MADSPPLVYAVCQAEYDAHGPHAVFTNLPSAERHAADCREVHGGRYEVVPLPFLGVAPQRADLHLRLGLLHRDGTLEGEQAWTVEHWDYDLPAEPVVTLSEGRGETVRVYVAAATPQAAQAAFRAAVEGMRAPAE